MAQVEEAAKKRALLPANQIVEQSENNNPQEAPDTRFLSAKNQKVEKQTVAKNRGQFQNVKKAASQKTGPKGDGKVKNVAESEDSKKALAKDLLKVLMPAKP